MRIITEANVDQLTSLTRSDNIEILLKCADISMYRAKERGKNQYLFYNSHYKV